MKQMVTADHNHWLLAFVISAVVAGVALYTQKTATPTYAQPSVILPFSQPDQAFPTQLSMNITEHPSSDGERLLTMERLEREDAITYTLYVTDTEDGELNEIHTLDESKDTELSIPFNAWAPTNSYFYVELDKHGVTNYLVFNAEGEPIGDMSYIDMSQEFRQNFPDAAMKEVTGWADYSMLLVNSADKEGKLLNSYWFTVPGKSFIPLARDFY